MPNETRAFASLLETRVVSDPGAVLEVVVITVPPEVQAAVAQNLERAEERARKNAPQSSTK
jgi:hypothetical protein